MKYCPICDRSYEDHVDACAVDGSTLMILGRPREDLVGKTVKGRYQVTRKLGEGGMAVVYLAEQINIGRTVAMKVLHHQYSKDQEFVKRFRQEARLAASLSHPNVIQIYDFDQADDGTLFIAMEYVAGKSLRALMQNGAVGVEKAVRLGIQMADGLETAHRSGVIHRDIKPENIMVVGDDEQIKLMDFGIARLRESGPGTKLTKTGIIMGTPMYMAPEQIEGGEVTEQTDIYALGIVLYEMLSGVTPFKAPTPAAVLMKQLKEIPTPLRKLRKEIPAPIQRIIAHTLEKRPDRRPKNMAEITTALEKQQRRLPQQTVPTTVIPQPTALLRTEVIDSSSTSAKPPASAGRQPGQTFQSQEGNTRAARPESEALNATVFVSDDDGRAAQTIAETMLATTPLEITRPRASLLKRAGLGATALILVIVGVIGYQTLKHDSVDTAVESAKRSAPLSSERKITSLLIRPEKRELSVKDRVRVIFALGHEDGQPTEVYDGVEWWSSDPSIAEVKPSGEIEAKTSGTAELRARYGKLEARPVTILVKDTTKVTPPPAPQILSLKIQAARSEMKEKERLRLRVKATYSDGTEGDLKNLRWQSSDPRIATVNAAGVVAGESEGKATITATYNEMRSDAYTVVVRSRAKQTPSRPVQELKPPQQEVVKQDAPAPLPNERMITTEYVKNARAQRDRGNYSRALLELEKARRIDPTSKEINEEILATQRACNAERVLVRPELRC